MYLIKIKNYIVNVTTIHSVFIEEISKVSYFVIRDKDTQLMYIPVDNKEEGLQLIDSLFEVLIKFSCITVKNNNIVGVQI